MRTEPSILESLAKSRKKALKQPRNYLAGTVAAATLFLTSGCGNQPPGNSEGEEGYTKHAEKRCVYDAYEDAPREYHGDIMWFDSEGNQNDLVEACGNLDFCFPINGSPECLQCVANDDCWDIMDNGTCQNNICISSNPTPVDTPPTQENSPMNLTINSDFSNTHIAELRTESGTKFDFWGERNSEGGFNNLNAIRVNTPAGDELYIRTDEQNRPIHIHQQNGAQAFVQEFLSNNEAIVTYATPNGKETTALMRIPNYSAKTNIAARALTNSDCEFIDELADGTCDAYTFYTNLLSPEGFATNLLEYLVEGNDNTANDTISFFDFLPQNIGDSFCGINRPNCNNTDFGVEAIAEDFQDSLANFQAPDLFQINSTPLFYCDTVYTSESWGDSDSEENKRRLVGPPDGLTANVGPGDRDAAFYLAGGFSQGSVSDGPGADIRVYGLTRYNSDFTIAIALGEGTDLTAFLDNSDIDNRVVEGFGRENETVEIDLRDYFDNLSGNYNLETRFALYPTCNDGESCAPYYTSAKVDAVAILNQDNSLGGGGPGQSICGYDCFETRCFFDVCVDYPIDPCRPIYCNDK